MRSLEMKRADMAPERKLCRLDLKLADVKLKGEIAGYGAVFGNVDGGGDIIMPNAFSASLARIKAEGRAVPMLWQHNPEKPLSVWDVIEEDGNGLKCAGSVPDDFELARQARATIANGAVTGLSVGFECIRYEIDENMHDKHGWPIRKLIEVDLWEISPVTFPMNASARINQIKAAGFAPSSPITSLAPLIADLKAIAQPSSLAPLIASLRAI